MKSEGMENSSEEDTRMIKRTKFKMFLYKHPYLCKQWLIFIEYLAKKVWHLSGRLLGYYHNCTSFYFMLSVGEERYKQLGKELTDGRKT
jgi:hypothetical protein